MEAFLNTALLVGVGEMGDKTQLLALLLAVRYRRSLPILGGIFLATLLTMSVTALVGGTIAAFVPPALLRWLLVAMFFAIAVWTLVPEGDEEEDEVPEKSTHGLVLTAFITFILAELGDKSQIATLVMAARYGDMVNVLGGATLGEMLAISPAVLLGKTTAQWLPMKWVRVAAAALFALLGTWVLLFGLE